MLLKLIKEIGHVLTFVKVFISLSNLYLINIKNNVSRRRRSPQTGQVASQTQLPPYFLRPFPSWLP